jgi:hypothetical protein
MDIEKREESLPDVKRDFREGIMDLESVIAADGYTGDSERCPLKHYFTEGIYCRRIFIPEGEIIVGKIHKHAHPNILMSGTVEVITEQEGKETLTGPLFMISEPGTKRALKALTDLDWITVHHNPSDTEDLEKLENIVIAEDYEAYENHLNGAWSRVKRVTNKIIKLLL